MKRLMAFFLLLVCGVMGLLFYGYSQQENLKQTIVSQLTEMGFKIKSEDIHLSLLTSPTLTLNNITYENPFLQAEMPQLTVLLKWYDLFQHSFPVNQIAFQQAHLFWKANAENWYNIQGGATLKQKTTDLAFPFNQQPYFYIQLRGENQASEQAELQTNLILSTETLWINQLHMRLNLKDRPYFANTFHLFLSQGEVKRDKQQFIFQFAQGQVNEVQFLQGTIQYQKTKQAPIQMKGEISLNQGNLHFIDQQTEWNDHLFLNATAIDIQPFWSLLKGNPFFDGRLDLISRIVLKNKIVEQMTSEVSVREGKLYYISLLTMLSRYIPLQNNKDLIPDNTPFEQLLGKLTYQNDSLDVSDLKVQMPYIQLVGRGKVDLKTQKCDFLLNASSPNYMAYTLPIHIYNQCQSPNYKIEFNQDLRHQAKEWLRRHLK